MSAAFRQAFFELHRDLAREGPGEPGDVEWAAKVAELVSDARICDAACGPGADIASLRAVAPRGHITALDKTEDFVKQAQATHHGLERTRIYAGDMASIEGPFDFIWCAGAIYFLGVTEGLQAWRRALAEGGAIAFSQLCWFTDAPSDAARAGWASFPAMTDEAGLSAQIDAAGYTCVAARRLSDAAWENYLSPLDARIAALQPNASGALTDVLQEARDEAALWRAERDTFGYLLCVVKPK